MSYSNLKPPTDPQPPPEGFYTYVPEPKPVLAQVAQGVVQAAVEARRKRILEKEMSKAPMATTRCVDISSSSGNKAPLDSWTASAAGKSAEVVLIEQTGDSERNNNGPNTKKTKLGTQPDLEHAVALIPSGSGASKPETGMLQRHGPNIYADEVVSDTAERMTQDSNRCHEHRLGKG